MTDEPDGNLLSHTIASSSTLKLAALARDNRYFSSVGERFDRITRVAAKLLNAPVTAITLFHHEAEWFKSVHGWRITNLPFREGLGYLAAQANEPVIIHDTATDARTQGHPLIAGGPCYRFYAGVPLYEGLGSVVGTFSVFDTQPRAPEDVDRQSIFDLGGMAQSEILADQIDGAQQALTSKLGAARREALMDPLTRVWNRRGGNLALKTAFEKADKVNQPVTVCLIDVDKFKTINDTYGHDIGDIVLRKIAEVLNSKLRENDVVSRLGGDEFLLVLHGADAEIASTAMERVRAALAEEPLRTRHGEVWLTVSAGYAVREPRSAKSAAEIILLADQALIASKAEGRNRVQAAVGA
jgi:diguanylate cyclase (GGDEF)-like protein